MASIIGSVVSAGAIPGDLSVVGNAVIGGTLDVTGVLTATGGFVGNVTGNLTGNVTGNVTGSGTNTLGTAAITTLNLAGLLTGTATSPAQITSNQTNYASMGSTLFCVLTSNASGYTIDGRSIASGQVQIVLNGNTAARTFVWVHEGSGTNKFACPTAVNYTQQPGQAVIQFYDPAISRVRVIPMT